MSPFPNLHLTVFIPSHSTRQLKGHKLTFHNRASAFLGALGQEQLPQGLGKHWAPCRGSLQTQAACEQERQKLFGSIKAPPDRGSEHPAEGAELDSVFRWRSWLCLTAAAGIHCPPRRSGDGKAPNASRWFHFVTKTLMPFYHYSESHPWAILQNSAANVHLTRELSLKRRFSGLRSLCAMFSEWQCCKAKAIWKRAQ